MRRRNSLASFLIIRDQFAKLPVVAIGGVEERMRHALGSIDIRTLAAIRLRSRILDSCELGVGRTAQEEILYEALPGEAEGELVGDDVDDYAVGADLCGCGFGGYGIGDKRCQANGQGWYDLLVSVNGGVGV